MAITSVIFDFDGTIADSIPAHRSAIRRIAGRHGVAITDDDFARYNGMSAREGARRMIEELHIPVTLMTVLKERKAAMSHIMAATTLYPQAKPCLSRLERYRKALATSSNKAYLRPLLSRFGIEDSFDAIATGDESRRTKPAPDIFLNAMRKLGEKPERCVVVEDSINGIIAAKRAGAAAIAVLTTTDKKLFAGEAEPDLFIKDLGGLDHEAVKAAESKAYIRRQVE